MPSDAALPEYAKPPVGEVALGAYFDPLLTLQSIHLGGLAQRWSDRYPKVEDHPELPAVPIEPPPGAPVVPTLNLHFRQGGSLPRVLFFSPGRGRLIQVQQDRLVTNWRRDTQEEAYPRFEELRPEFLQTYRDLEAFATEQAIGPIRPVQCEVTYVNPVPTSVRSAIWPSC